MLLRPSRSTRTDTLFPYTTRFRSGREAVLALEVGVDVVEVAVDHHLPGDLHGVAVDGGEDAVVLAGLVEDLAVVRQRDAVLAVREDVAGARVFLHPPPVPRLDRQNGRWGKSGQVHLDVGGRVIIKKK